MVKLLCLTAQWVISFSLGCGLVPLDDRIPVSNGGTMGHQPLLGLGVLVNWYQQMTNFRNGTMGYQPFA